MLYFAVYNLFLFICILLLFSGRKWVQGREEENPTEEVEDKGEEEEEEEVVIDLQASTKPVEAKKAQTSFGMIMVMTLVLPVQQKMCTGQ